MENHYNPYLQSILKKKKSAKDSIRSPQTARSTRGVKSMANDRLSFFRELKNFQVNNGYLLRMIEDGDNVILSDELKTRLYMTADEVDAGIDMESGQKGATYGMTK